MHHLNVTETNTEEFCFCGTQERVHSKNYYIVVFTSDGNASDKRLACISNLPCCFKKQAVFSVCEAHTRFVHCSDLWHRRNDVNHTVFKSQHQHLTYDATL